MGSYVISGGRKLSGSIRVESAKNAVLPMLAGACIIDGETIIKSPMIADVFNMCKIIKSTGAQVNFQSGNVVINAKNMANFTVSEDMGGKLRSSIFMLGAFLSKFKKARLCYPGGCDIGQRPIDMHICALKQMGVTVIENKNELICFAEKIKGANIYLPYPSVGATENVILAGVKAEGTTIIHNCAIEPEICDFINFLNTAGAKIKVISGRKIVIQGVKSLCGIEYIPIGDRIEAGTYLFATLICGGNIEIQGCLGENILPYINKFCNNTCNISKKNDIIKLTCKKVGKHRNFVTGPYPEFPTDLQAQAMAFLSVSKGVSVVKESVFENRFAHAKELCKMGANITISDGIAAVKGVRRLNGCEVIANDLRGGASLVLAGLNAEGVTTVNDIYHVKRGYYDMAGKLLSLGADIKELI